MSASPVKYRYESLGKNEIRRLSLLGSKSTDRQFRGTLTTTSPERRNYYALSYEWGPPTQLWDNRMIMSDKGYLLLTKNLYKAIKDLVSVFHSDSEYYIDQVCIDQDDNEEKSVQVAMMGRVYTYAEKVITYLGPRADTDDDALQLLDRIDKHFGSWFEELNEDFDMLDRFARRQEAPEHLKTFPMSSTDKEALESLYDIVYKTGWTRRLWMLQENVSNRNVVFLRGRKILSRRSVHLLPFCAAFGFLPHPKNVTASEFMNALKIADAYRDIQQNDDKKPLIEVINEFGTSLDCKEPKDKIYALLGVADTHISMKPDYNADNLDVYKDFVLKSIEDMATLHIFDKIHQNSTSSNFDSAQLTHPTSKSYWPSWVPSFKVGAPPRIKGSASGTTCAQVTCSDLRLEIKGYEVETIESVIGTFDDDAYITGSVHRDVIKGILKTLLEARRLLAKTEPRNASAILCYTIMASDTSPSSYTLPEWTGWANRAMDKILDGFGDFRRSGKRYFVEFASTPEEFISAEIQNGIMARMNIANRSLCMTESGKLLLGPKAAQADDKVVVLLGGEPLYVIRRRGQTTFDLLGPAFIHGYMHGESLYDDKWISDMTKTYDTILGDEYVDFFKAPIPSWWSSDVVKEVQKSTEKMRPVMRQMCTGLIGISMMTNMGFLIGIGDEKEKAKEYRNSDWEKRKDIMLKAVTRGPLKPTHNKRWRKEFWGVWDLKITRVFPQPPFKNKLQSYKFT